MHTRHENLWTKAKELRGSLSELKTISGRRLHGAEEETEDPLQMESDFVSDEAKLFSCKAFRLLEHKTQVVTAPINPLIRNRKTHVLEVVAVSVVVICASILQQVYQKRMQCRCR